ncbi:hypothetical protein OG927_34525 (plasmid) [Streptomyces clavifer]|uniref:hypothetical protein n=1 Tax=Streptomyces clavifer TaxID=68188 RepID=UPI002E821CEC|nr:hypothetical protein [Streptomyces clavifer]WUC32476.1 hypothetical protein OG927_34525 [Streptomyces clavifer]
MDIFPAAQAQLDPVDLLRVLMAGVSLIGRSPRQAVAGYFEHHGVSRRVEGDRLIVDLPTGSAVVRIGRIGNIRLAVSD